MATPTRSLIVSRCKSASAFNIQNMCVACEQLAFTKDAIALSTVHTHNPHTENHREWAHYGYCNLIIHDETPPSFATTIFSLSPSTSSAFFLVRSLKKTSPGGVIFSMSGHNIKMSRTVLGGVFGLTWKWRGKWRKLETIRLHDVTDITFK